MSHLSPEPAAAAWLASESFAKRHLGPTDAEVAALLRELGFNSLEDLQKAVIPSHLVTKGAFPKLKHALSEHECLVLLKTWMGQNQVFDSLIGLGFHDCITPAVILRNVFENPAWYTAYTPYQPEISQGRLEALLNFQTMVCEMTAMEIANASMLDEGSSTAEAINMAIELSKSGTQKVLLDEDLHPHVRDVVLTRADFLGWEIVTAPLAKLPLHEPHACVVIAYPSTTGHISDLTSVIEKSHAQKALAVVDADLLSLALLKPPGEMGADIVVGNSQRLGVPLGNGGPHAAFLATKNIYKRSLPGRLVGVSIDAEGKRALRLTLQTREQHIRREKATSNICTAQVLLANMASFFAVYHGSDGLRAIARKIHGLAQIFAAGLRQAGIAAFNSEFFDTVTVETIDAKSIYKKALGCGMNLRLVDDCRISIAFNQTSTLATVEKVLSCFTSSAIDTLAITNSIEKLAIPTALERRGDCLLHSIFRTHQSETDLMRYIRSLETKDISLVHSMIPLGSCTMKLNAAAELLPVSWPEVAKIHPFAPADQLTGYKLLIDDLSAKLCELTGFHAVTLQPNAGSQGEYAGLITIANYLRSIGQGARKICLIPHSAHGTNPASAVLAGMKVVVVGCDDQGNIDLGDLKTKATEHASDLAALMVTYPSTHGVFEESIREICTIVHENGGLVYMDGANLNALVGVCKPAEFGADVAHMNLHKTFAIPHGGGGPGVGPIGVVEKLTPFLPKHVASAPHGSASILPISWAYITMMGAEGLKKATQLAILNANYVAAKLEKKFPVLYRGRNGFVAHECILDLRGYKNFVDVNDVAKRLMDFGFHAPTMSWPVPGTLMVEPTESESKRELDRFVQAMLEIAAEIDLIANGSHAPADSPLKRAPHTFEMLLKTDWTLPYSRETAAFPLPWVRKNKVWPAVARIDNAYGDKNIFCSCPPVEDFSTEESTSKVARAQTTPRDHSALSLN